MKTIVSACLVVVSALLAIPLSSFAATEKEQTFLDAYKKAFEAKDAATLKSFLYTKGSDPTVVEFFSMMMTSEMGGKLTSIQLRDLTPEDVKEAAAVQPLPDGRMAKLNLKPMWKLVLKVDSADANGHSTSSNETFVAEADGKLWIPVPSAVK